MTVAIWIIAICILLTLVWKVLVASLNFYLHRTQYKARSKFKKFMNWVLNGHFD